MPLCAMCNIVGITVSSAVISLYEYMQSHFAVVLTNACPVYVVVHCNKKKSTKMKVSCSVSGNSEVVLQQSNRS
jgi:hypothetical protein